MSDEGGVFISRGEATVHENPIVLPTDRTMPAAEIRVERRPTVEDLAAELGRARLDVARKNVEINDLESVNAQLRIQVTELQAELEAAQ